MPRSVEVTRTKGEGGFWPTMPTNRLLRKANRSVGENSTGVIAGDVRPVANSQKPRLDYEDELAGARAIVVTGVFGVALWLAVARVATWCM